MTALPADQAPTMLGMQRLRRWTTIASPRARTWALTAVLAAAGLALCLYSLRWGSPRGRTTLTWWELVPAVIVADELSFHLEVRGEVHTFNISELPLVLGCLFASPAALIAARLIGGGAFQLFRMRQRGIKLAFNFANCLLESAAAVFLIRHLVGSRAPTEWQSWVLVLLAVGVADLVGVVAVSCPVRWFGGESQIRRVLLTGALTALVNVNLALLGAVVLWTDPAAMVLLGVVLLMTSLAYRGYANLSKRYAGLKLLYEFTEVAGASISAEAALDRMLTKARYLLKAEFAEVLLADAQHGIVTFRQRSTDGDPRPRPLAHTVEVALAEVLRAGQTLHVARSDKSAELAALREAFECRDLIAAPLRSDEAVVGAIVVANRLSDISTFDEDDRRLFETLANHASITIENSRLLGQLRQEAEDRRQEALHDSLTGLPNRRHFYQLVNSAEADVAARNAVMLMDLDRFKDVNDTLGHHNGDLLLREVAVRLADLLGEHDTAARLSGDEFAILLRDIRDVDQAEAVGRQILTALEAPFCVDNLSLTIGASIGIAVSPEHGNEAATLLRRADVAMYEAKSARSGSATYSTERDTYSTRRLKLAGDLSRAIDEGELLVHLQPKAEAASGNLLGAEALVRWRHPELGLVPPDEFISLAEQAGLIVPLTTHVLACAVRRCGEWRRAGHDVGVAVNLAVRSLLDKKLPETVMELLVAEGVPASALTLEITESSIMADPARTIEVLEVLARAGIRLSVDDFGTGYSSLTYLRRLPVHEVKIDKSFVIGMAANPADAVIVQSIVELGHNLGLTVVAEGVEDQPTWDVLTAMSCDVVQGFHLGQPMLDTDFAAWIGAYNRSRTARAAPELRLLTAPLKWSSDTRRAVTPSG